MAFSRRDLSIEIALIDMYNSEEYTITDLAKIFCTNYDEVSNILHKYRVLVGERYKRRSPKFSNIQYITTFNEKEIIVPITIIDTLKRADRFTGKSNADPKLYANGELVLNKGFFKKFSIINGKNSLKIHIGGDENKDKFILLEVVNNRLSDDPEYCRAIDGKTVHISIRKYLAANGIKAAKHQFTGVTSESLFGKTFIVLPVPKSLLIVEKQDESNSSS